MSKRMRDLFLDAQTSGRKLFIPYVTAGYPRREDTVPILLACETGAPTSSEIGMPLPTHWRWHDDPARESGSAGRTGSRCKAARDRARGPRTGLKARVVFRGYYNRFFARRRARNRRGEGVWRRRLHHRGLAGRRSGQLPRGLPGERHELRAADSTDEHGSPHRSAGESGRCLDVLRKRNRDDRRENVR